MYIMFTYGDNYVGKQISSNRVGCCTHLHCFFCTKRTPFRKDPCCANVCAFLFMLMRVKRQTSNKAGGVWQNGMKNKRLIVS